MGVTKKVKPAKVVSVHMYCDDCDVEMDCNYRVSIFKIYDWLLTCPECKRTEKSVMHYPHTRFVLMEEE